MGADPWVEYARLQSMLDRTTDAYKAAGIEAAMTDLLEGIAKHRTIGAKQARNLVVNRIGKERRRRAIIYARRHNIAGDSEGCGVADAAESRIMLLRCAQACGPRDFRLLVRQAQGNSLAEISAETGATITALKARAHRARKKVLALAA
ncbi:MAG: sigma-70 family RNA polymerase sigma factor [Alteromonadaceae bacterium]|nr:sigma-70 family RNA polymerase sigma factor [Alteromonadaceae bacterium]